MAKYFFKTDFEKYLESGYAEFCDFKTYQYYRKYTRRNIVAKIILWLTKLMNR